MYVCYVCKNYLQHICSTETLKKTTGLRKFIITYDNINNFFNYIVYKLKNRVFVIYRENFIKLNYKEKFIINKNFYLFSSYKYSARIVCVAENIISLIMFIKSST